ncbi:MAG: hypothetical protein ACRC4T_08210 [Cetobacterium sp.]
MSLIESYFKEKDEQQKQLQKSSTMTIQGFGFTGDKPFIEIKFKSGFSTRVFFNYNGITLWNGAKDGVIQSVKKFIIENKWFLQNCLKPTQNYKEYLNILEKIKELESGQEKNRLTSNQIGMNNYMTIRKGWY